MKMKCAVSENFRNHVCFSNSNYHSIISYMKYEGIKLKRFCQILNSVNLKNVNYGYPFSYLQFKYVLSDKRYIQVELNFDEYDDIIEFNYTFWNDKPIAKKRGK